MFGCVVMVTLIIVIAVKLSKQCMPAQGGRPTAGKGQRSGSGSGSPSAKANAETKAVSVCEAGFRPDENGFCVEDD